MMSNFNNFISSVSRGKGVNSTNRLAQNGQQFTPTRSMDPDSFELNQAQGGLGENVRLTKKKFGLSRNYKNRNTIAAFDGSKVISADTIGNLTQKEFKDSNKFTRKFILQFLHTKLDKCLNDDSKLTNLILSIKNTVTTQGKLAATTNDDIKLALTFLNKILEGTKEYNKTISTNMMETLEAFSKVDKISVETKNEIETLKEAVRPKQTEIAPNTGDNSSNNVSKIVTHDLPSSDKTAISNRIDELGDRAQNSANDNVIRKLMTQLVNIALNPEAREQVINKIGDIVQNPTIFNLVSPAFKALCMIALNTEAGEQVINKIGDIAQNSKVETKIRKIAIHQLGVLAQNPKTTKQAIQKLIETSRQVKDKDIKNIAITQFRVIAQNSKVDPNTRDLARGALSVSALDPLTSDLAINQLVVLAQNRETSDLAINQLVVLAQNRETSDLAINKLGDIAQNTKDETVLSNAINGLGDIAQTSGDKNVINNVMIQLVNIAQNSKVDPNIRKHAISQLGVLAQNPKTGSLAINQLVVLAQNPLTTKQAIQELVVLALTPETTKQAINELVNMAQNTKDETVLSNVINGLGYIAQNTETSSAQAINKSRSLDQNTETRELIMDEFRVLAQNTKTGYLAINEFGVLARNANLTISSSAISHLAFIVLNPGIDEKTKEKAINKLGDIVQDPTVAHETKEKAIRQLGICARKPEAREQVINKLGVLAQNPKTGGLAINGLVVLAQNPEAREQVINKLGVLAQNPKTGDLAINGLKAIARNTTVDQETIEKAINGLGAIAQTPKVDQKTKEKAINGLKAIAQTPKVDQKTKDFAIRQLGMIAKSNDIALKRLCEIAQADVLLSANNTTTIKSVVLTLTNVAQMSPYAVKNELEALAQIIKDEKKTAQNIELLNFINSAIDKIDMDYAEAYTIEINNKKASLQQNS